MKIVEPTVKILTPLDGPQILRHLEDCGRVCYQSESNKTEDSYQGFINRIIKSGHEAVLEHYSATVEFVCDRGVTHEIVRHRLASYCQESTRYCCYANDKFGNEITVIKPCFWDEHSALYGGWEVACRQAERTYFELIENGATPQEARSVLPNSLKTTLVMTANMREWRHFLRLRTSEAAHPQIREVSLILLDEFKDKIPILFDDILPSKGGFE